MARSLRLDVGGEIYHCLNRAVGRQTIFKSPKDYAIFEQILVEVNDISNVKVLAYCIMPNHFHLVLQTEKDGELSEFMKFLTATHTQRHRVITHSVGEGPVYQGRYKSFIVQNDEHLFTVLRYVERNPFTAKLVNDPLGWKYSSAFRRYKGTVESKKLLAKWPIDEPSDYVKILKSVISKKEIEKLEKSEQKGVPFGDAIYILNIVKKYGLESTLREKGRPKSKK